MAWMGGAPVFASAAGALMSSSSERPRLEAVRLDVAPKLDGVVLSDPAWDGVEPARDFWQTRPFAGRAASEQTEVRLGFTDDTLYVGVVCFDREPDRIIISDARRDASLDDTDSFQIIFDTFEDGQNGFVFGTNPAGIEYDGQVVNQGQGGFGRRGGRFNRGSGGGFNLNWDGDWEVRTRLGERGWSAEFAIPFRTLRYPPRRGQSWRVNFQRNIRRRNEIAYWAPLDQQFNLYRVSDAGFVGGVEPPRQRNFQLVPYVLAQARQASDRAGTEDDQEIGLDAKYSITPSLTLDVTVNTDFAQVEVDEQQINLDRFNLFFPEKRPFFLENAGLFSVGATGEAELFFSRRIGISEDGAPIPIDGGLRISGKAKGFNVGFLGMRTAETGSFAQQFYGVARLAREFGNRSRIGGIFVNRDASGSLATGDDENQTFGIDGQVGIGQYHTLSGFVARTRTPGLDGDDYAVQADYSLSSPKWRAALGYLEVGNEFNPEVGFLTRKNFRRPFGFIMRQIRPEHLWGLHELRPHVSYRAFWDFDGFKETEFTHIDNHWEWRNGYELHTGYNLTYEGVKEAFEIADGVIVQPGEYSHREAQIVFNTNQGAPISFATRATVGGFFGGDRVSLDNTLKVRRGERLTSELGWNYNDVSLPVGDFQVNLGRLRVSYSLSTRLLLQALVQYNDASDRISTNLRFSWQQAANTGLFVVYNEIDDFGTRFPLERPDRSLIVKFSRLVNVFGRR